MAYQEITVDVYDASAEYDTDIADIVLSNGAVAGNMKIVEATAAAVDKVEVMYFAINGGAALHFKTPIKLTANANLGITTVTCTTHSITVSGYTAP